MRLTVHRSGSTPVTSTPGYQGTTHTTAPTVSSYNTTHVHQTFWIRRANGKELELDLTDRSVRVHDDHIVSAIYAAKRGRDRARHTLLTEQPPSFQPCNRVGCACVSFLKTLDDHPLNAR